MNAESISFSGELTEPEYRKILKVAGPRFMKWFPWFLLVCAIGILATGGGRVILDNPRDQLPRLGFVAVFGLALIFGPRWAAGKAWRSNAALRRPISGSVSASGLEFNSAFTRGSFSWRDLYRYRETDDVLVIYTGVNQALWLLGRFFASPEEWNRAREIVTANLKKK